MVKSTPEWVLARIELAKLDKTRKLDLRWKSSYKSEKLESVPKEILDLPELEFLILTDNRINELPFFLTELNNLKELDLRSNNFASIPQFLGLLPQLTKLALSYNPLREFPSWMAEYDHWHFLHLAGLKIQSMPDWISRQVNLEYLNLSNNKISQIPETFEDLIQLRMLSLGGNNLSGWPYVICKLQNLVKLNLNRSKLIDIPYTIGLLDQLRYLSFSDNEIVDLPIEFGLLNKLSFFDISKNRLSYIPECIFDLSDICELKFQGNFITEVPKKLTQLSKLSRLDIKNNPINTPPLEIAVKGINAIRNYYEQAESDGIDYLYEAKLLIVGEPGAGKTSLARKLQNDACELRKDEDSTQGIEISQWHYPLEANRKFRINIWDFGGQEIYHATHQYFLTKRSLYLLVADTREENTDFEFWLNVIDLLSDGSPVLIIKNEKHERKRELDERLLRGRFKNLCEVVAVNLATNRGLSQLQDAIRYHIHQLPHIGTRLPKTWIKVRAVLENESRNYISITEYLTICKMYGFKERSDALQLSGYLHDLGVCLHFQDDPVLKNIVILKPQWGTDAAYKVLDNPAVIANLGGFTRADLSNIWNRPEYEGMQDELLQLMMRFRLCYPLPDVAGDYMAPQLLSLKQPDYVWDEKENLQLRYCYEFMPKGLIIQLIVSLHERIANQNFAWRTGVVLEGPNALARAEVIEYYSQREIHIRVSGIQKIELLSIVSHEMQKIHFSYPSLKYETLIPCNCRLCKDQPDPQFYSLEILYHFLQNNRTLIQCQRNFTMVDVHGLINDVFEHLSTLQSGEIDDMSETDQTTQYLHIDTIENFYYQPGQTNDQRLINTGGGTYVEGNAEVEGDFVGRDQQNINFPMLYEIIQGSDKINDEDKPRLRESVEDIEAELKEGGEEPNEGFLTRRFKNIARMAPDILDVILAAAINPAAGFTEAARKIAKRAAEQAKSQ